MINNKINFEENSYLESICAELNKPFLFDVT